MYVPNRGLMLPLHTTTVEYTHSRWMVPESCQISSDNLSGHVGTALCDLNGV